MSKPQLFFLLVLSFAIQAYCERWNSNYWNKNERFDGFGEEKITDNCKTYFTDEVRQLIIDYSKWRNFQHFYIVDDKIRKGCNIRTIKRSLNCFNANGLTFSLQTHFRKPTDSVVPSLVFVTFVKDQHNANTTKEYASELSLTVEKFSWLIIVTNISALGSLEDNLFDALRNSSLDLDDQLAVAVSISNEEKEIKNDFSLHDCKRRFQKRSVDDLSKQKVQTDLPFLHRQNKSLDVSKYVEKHCHCNVSENREPGQFCLLQIYKLRWNFNNSLVVTPLGVWSYENGTRDLKPFQTTEKRLNLHSFPLIFGKKKATEAAEVVDENIIEDVNDSENMERIGDYILTLLNAQEYSKSYSTLGKKQATGEWTGLLGGVIKQEVDVGLESVIQVSERSSDMMFSQTIMGSIRCIYLRPEESHSARDIFLIPFGTSMSLCMVAMIIIVATFMAIYLKIVKYIWRYKHLKGESRDARVSDATIWVSSVLFMQGSNITPKTSSAKIIVVSCMLFALIVNTSYQGFITSILSIKLASIRTVDDLLNSDYDIGYAKNSQDEIFLRTQNNISQLNQIYLRGYLHNDINNITEGIFKATKGGYGFFATMHVARKKILRISSAKCRFDIMEIVIPSTRYQVALPMSKTSPYKRLINFCVIKMFETGIYAYIRRRIAPKIPACDQERLYTSARINDLSTAFLILAIGIVAGVSVFFAERIWYNRRKIWRYFKNRGLNNIKPRRDTITRY